MSDTYHLVADKADATTFRVKAEAIEAAEAFRDTPGIKAEYGISIPLWDGIFRVRVAVTAPLRMTGYLKVRTDA